MNLTVTITLTNAQALVLRRLVSGGQLPSDVVTQAVAAFLQPFIQQVQQAQATDLTNVLAASVNATPDVQAQVDALIKQAKALVGVV